MKIFIVTDKYGSAIHRLSEEIAKHNEHHDIKVLPVHPKRADLETIHNASQLVRWCDVLHVAYWKSGEVIATSFPKDFQNKPKILTHHNPYNLREKNWIDIYDAVVVKNSEMQAVLPYAKLIPHTVDLSVFTYREELPKTFTVNMVSGRIEGKKGVKEVARACRELQIPFRLIGRVSSGEYMREVLKAGGEHLTFLENVTEEQLVEEYHKASVHICNSIDNFESGTMPILEAMACGVPVITRAIGHTCDTYNGENMVMRKGKQEDVEEIKTILSELKAQPYRLQKLAQKGWETVKNRPSQKSARMYSQLYAQVKNKNAQVSVIIPTVNRYENLIESLASISAQKEYVYEVVIADSSENSNSFKSQLHKIRETTGLTIKHLQIKRNGYNLAEARNRAVIESEGKILLFLDDRLKLSANAIKIMLNYVQYKTWVWGTKNGYKKAFVENFSMIDRKSFIEGGMFCERMNTYGGLSQETRTRFQKQGYLFIDTQANAEEISKSQSSNRKQEIVESKLKIWKMYG